MSLLFDVFVLNQRLRTLLALVMRDTGMRADEYAVYSVLFEDGGLTPTQMATRMAMPVTTVLDYVRGMAERGHLEREKHPSDGRSYTVSLTMRGVSAQRRANASWNRAVAHLEGELGPSIADVRAALHRLDDASAAALAALSNEAASKVG